VSVASKWKWNRRTGSLLLALIPALAGAVDRPGWLQELELHAFLSQGYVNTTHNMFMGDSPSGSFDFREVGANASLRLSPRWLVSAQLLSRKAGEMSNGSVQLDYGLVDFTAHASETWRLGFIGGRYKNPIGFYNDTRDVPFTRPSVFLPQSIYWEKLRDIMLSTDGVQAYGEYFHGNHSLALQLGIGLPRIDENLEWTYLGNNWPGEFEADRLSKLFRLAYEFNGGQIRLSLSGLDAALSFEGAPSSPIGSGKNDFQYWVGSFQYNAENWSFTTEYAQEPVEWRDYRTAVQRNYPSPALDKSVVAEGLYLQGIWLFSEEWEVMLRYDAAFLDRNDRDGTEQSRETGYRVPAHNYYAKTWSLGLTWTINRHFMLRGQLDRVNGTAFLSTRENPDPTALTQRWTMFSLLFSAGF
jgi:hypothetical protein